LRGIPLSHVSFSELRSDPIGVLQRVYSELGLSMSGTVRDSISQVSGRLGTESPILHEWNFELLGLDRENERARFAIYCDAFAVSEEVL
jgi:hypothetical protein